MRSNVRQFFHPPGDRCEAEATASIFTNEAPLAGIVSVVKEENNSLGYTPNVARPLSFVCRPNSDRWIPFAPSNAAVAGLRSGLPVEEGVGRDKPFPAGAVLTQFIISSPTDAVFSTLENKSSTKKEHTLRSSTPRFIRISSLRRGLIRLLLG